MITRHRNTVCVLAFFAMVAGCGTSYQPSSEAVPPASGNVAASASQESRGAPGVTERGAVPVPSSGPESKGVLSPNSLAIPPGARRAVPFHKAPRPMELGDSFDPFRAPVAPAGPLAPTIAAPAPLAPALEIGFAGLPDPGNIIPPDTMGAAGPSSLISTLNSDVGVFNKTGGQPTSRSTLTEFWTPLSRTLPPRSAHFPFDPRILYDPGIERFVFISVTGQQQDAGNSWILLAVSRDSAPSTAPSDWNMWAIPSDNVRKTTWADYPCLGIDGNNVYVTANMYNSSNTYVGSKIWAIPKAQLLPSNPQTTELERTEFQYPPGSDFTLHPAHTFGPAPAEYFVYEDRFTSGGLFRNLHIARIDNTGWLALGTVAIRPYPVSPDPSWTAPQPPGATGGIEINDTRILNAVFRNGRLYATHHVPNDTNTGSEVAWYEIDPTTAPPRLLQQGRITDAPMFYYFPSIAVNAKGDIAVGFSGSSPGTFAGAYYTARFSSDPAGTMQPVAPLKLGNGTYYNIGDDNENRWGDYSATVVDPTDDLSFWTLQEYVALKDTWGTYWGNFHLSEIAASALSTGNIRVTWVDGYATETGFTVERSSSGQGPFTAIATEPPGTTSLIDTGLSEATRYFYRVLVNPGIATLGPDNTVTLPAAPDNLVATKTAAYSIRLTWRDNSRGEKGYKVERGLPTTGFAVVANLPDNTTSYLDSGLPGSTTFQYRVVAYTDGGDSLPSNVASATTDPAPSGGGGGCAAVTPSGGSTADASSILSLLVLFLPAAVYGWKRHCPC